MNGAKFGHLGWSIPRRWLEDSAQGFNPGNPQKNVFALKGERLDESRTYRRGYFEKRRSMQEHTLEAYDSCSPFEATIQVPPKLQALHL